jgi:hypothetical protein
MFLWLFVKKLLRLLLLIALLPLLFACSVQVWPFLVAGINFELFFWFFAGVLLYTLLHGAAGHLNGPRSSDLAFTQHLKHELSHVLVGGLFMQGTREMKVNPDQGSEVRFRNRGGPQGLISLAPYYLPLFTIPFLFLRLIVNPPYDGWVNLGIGFTLAFHYLQLVGEYGSHQTDITSTGRIYALVVTLFMNLMFFFVVKCFVFETYSDLVDYSVRSWSRIKDYYRATWTTLRPYWVELVKTVRQ